MDQLNQFRSAQDSSRPEDRVQVLSQMRFYLGAKLGDHVELRDQHIVIGVSSMILFALMNDLYLQLWDFLHAKNMISRRTDDHLPAPIHKGLLQGGVV